MIISHNKPFGLMTTDAVFSNYLAETSNFELKNNIFTTGIIACSNIKSRALRNKINCLFISELFLAINTHYDYLQIKHIIDLGVNTR